MNYKIRDIIAFSDGNNYEIASKTEYQDQIYYLLVDANNDENVKLCKQIPDEKEFLLEETHDADLLVILLPKFAKEIFKLFGYTEEN